MVVDSTSGMPVGGLAVLVRRTVGDRSANEHRLLSEADGRFRLDLPAGGEEPADVRISFEVQVPPGYVGFRDCAKRHTNRRGHPLVELRRGQELGLPPYFGRLLLFPTRPITGRVAAPDASPADGNGVLAGSLSLHDKATNPHRVVRQTLTGADGRFEAEVASPGRVVLFFLTERYAPRAVTRRATPWSHLAIDSRFGTVPDLPDIDVRDDVEHLPHDLPAVVVLCYLEGLTHGKAVRRLRSPVGTVRSRLARARARLRAGLTRRGMAPDAALMPMLAFRKLSLPEGLIDATVKAAIALSGAMRERPGWSRLRPSRSQSGPNHCQTFVFWKYKLRHYRGTTCHVTMERPILETLTVREAQIMDAIWRLGAVSAERVRRALPDPLHDSTVRTLLRVLESKGYVSHEYQGKSYIYCAVVEREKAQRDALRSLLARFFGGSAQNLVRCLVEDEQITLKQLDELLRTTFLPPHATRLPSSGRKQTV